ncbi:hypothetical protein RCL1_002225 [Eukaryota sp. TZLM3-RCL]
MKTVGLLVFPGVEPIEAFACIDVLSRASAKTTIISVFDSSEVLTAHNISINPQTSLSSISDSLFDLVILPGGPLLGMILHLLGIISVVINIRSDDMALIFITHFYLPCLAKLWRVRTLAKIFNSPKFFLPVFLPAKKPKLTRDWKLRF